MFDWLNDLWGWVEAIWDAFYNFLLDLPILVLDDFLTALAALIASIQLPDFIGTPISALMGGLPDGVGYMVSVTGVNEALGFIGAAYVFRFTRKVLTFFQW